MTSTIGERHKWPGKAAFRGTGLKALACKANAARGKKHKLPGACPGIRDLKLHFDPS